MARDLFEKIGSPAARAEGLAAYAEFLSARDGTPNLEKRSLSKREESMQRFEAPKALFHGRIDQSLFEAQFLRFDPKRPTPRELLLLLTFVKINASEAYGVEEGIAGLLKKGKMEIPSEGTQLMVLLEEYY